MTRRILNCIPAFCDGKERFQSAEIAKEVADRRQRGRTYSYYHCANCGFWHVGGHSLRERKMRIRVKHAKHPEDR